MKLLTSFSQSSPNRVFLSIVLGLFAGICYSGLIPLLLASVQPKDPMLPEVNGAVELVFGIEVSHFYLAIVYFVACLLILLMRSFSEILLLRVAIDVAKALRIKFYRQIADASLSSLEKVGASSLVAAINIDVPRIISGGRALPMLLVNSVTLIGMLAFLMYLNADIFRLVMVAIVIGATCYQLPMIAGRRLFERSREVHDKLQQSINGLVYGAKELKLDALKRQLYFDQNLYQQEQLIRDNEVKGQTVIRLTMSFGDLLSFFVIGCVSFIFVNYYQISGPELLGVVMALLYVSGPIAIILNFIPMLMVAAVSYRKLNSMLSLIPPEPCSDDISPLQGWHSIRFSEVEYRYPDAGNEAGFHVGPLNFEMVRGSITFIVGANGSGKSTMSKLLTLHYTPSDGVIYFGDIAIDNNTRNNARQSICAIYSDYHLFDRLLLPMTDALASQAKQYLEKLHLQHKVTIEDGQFSTLSLSDGQRKRLALLVAFLEDKDIYLFDEWAADQDPLFKHVFYTEILPELKARNKVVIVISHDDRYFDVADHLYVMEQGRLTAKNKASPVFTAAAATPC